MKSEEETMLALSASGGKAAAIICAIPKVGDMVAWEGPWMVANKKMEFRAPAGACKTIEDGKICVSDVLEDSSRRFVVMGVHSTRGPAIALFGDWDPEVVKILLTDFEFSSEPAKRPRAPCY